MKKELNYFTIDGSLGWNQNLFADWSMYYGGCAAVTACDLSIYLAKEKGLVSLYPYNAQRLTREEYLAFSKTMKRYLGPRWKGVDTLGLYTSGLSQYLQEVGGALKMVEVSGTLPWIEARRLIQEQIDLGIIIPYLLLLHKNRSLKDFRWHWFNLAGYKESDGEFYVKAVSYGTFRWFHFQDLWDTGHKRKGGFIRVLA